MICVDAPIASLVLNQNGTKEEKKTQQPSENSGVACVYENVRMYVWNER